MRALSRGGSPSVAALPIMLLLLGCQTPVPVAPPANGAPTPNLHGDLHRGSAVGFTRQRVQLRLPTDALGAPAGDSIPADLYLWYPARGDDTHPPMTMAGYYAAQEETPPSAEELRGWLKEDMTSPPAVTDAQLDAVLAAPLRARRDAVRAEGAHPLVLWSYRDSVPTMQAVLNEYLAGHGYVVAFVWPAGPLPPFPWNPEVTPQAKLDALDFQRELLVATFDTLADEDWIDETRSAVISWSYGGESAFLLQETRPELRLALGLDSTLAGGWVYRTGEILEAVRGSDIDTPLVLIRHGRPRLGAADSTEPPLLAQAGAGAWHVRLPRLSHGNFNFPGGMIPGVLGLDEVSAWAVGGPDAQRGYESICRLTRQFLDVHLRDAPLDSIADGVDDGFVEVTRRAR